MNHDEFSTHFVSIENPPKSNTKMSSTTPQKRTLSQALGNNERENTSYNAEKLWKKRRRQGGAHRFRADEIALMEAYYETGDYWPSRPMREWFGKVFGVPQRTIQVWFQNHRAKLKTTKKTHFFQGSNGGQAPDGRMSEKQFPYTSLANFFSHFPNGLKNFAPKGVPGAFDAPNQTSSSSSSSSSSNTPLFNSKGLLNPDGTNVKHFTLEKNGNGNAKDEFASGLPFNVSSTSRKLTPFLACAVESTKDKDPSKSLVILPGHLRAYRLVPVGVPLFPQNRNSQFVMPNLDSIAPNSSRSNRFESSQQGSPKSSLENTPLCSSPNTSWPNSPNSKPWTSSDCNPILPKLTLLARSHNTSSLTRSKKLSRGNMAQSLHDVTKPDESDQNFPTEVMPTLEPESPQNAKQRQLRRPLLNMDTIDGGLMDLELDLNNPLLPKVENVGQEATPSLLDSLFREHEKIAKSSGEESEHEFTDKSKLSKDRNSRRPKNLRNSVGGKLERRSKPRYRCSRQRQTSSPGHMRKSLSDTERGRVRWKPTGKYNARAMFEKSLPGRPPKHLKVSLRKRAPKSYTFLRVESGTETSSGMIRSD